MAPRELGVNSPSVGGEIRAQADETERGELLARDGSDLPGLAVALI